VKDTPSRVYKWSSVVSLNLHRRHLTSSQLAFVALALEPHYAEKAKQRQLAAQNNDAGRAVRGNRSRTGKG
jgi:hypothetical protein